MTAALHGTAITRPFSERTCRTIAAAELRVVLEAARGITDAL